VPYHGPVGDSALLLPHVRGDASSKSPYRADLSIQAVQKTNLRGASQASDAAVEDGTIGWSRLRDESIHKEIWRTAREPCHGSAEFPRAAATVMARGVFGLAACANSGWRMPRG